MVMSPLWPTSFCVKHFVIAKKTGHLKGKIKQEVLIIVHHIRRKYTINKIGFKACYTKTI